MEDVDLRKYGRTLKIIPFADNGKGLVELYTALGVNAVNYKSFEECYTEKLSKAAFKD